MDTRSQNGAALIMGLIFLLVLTVLATAGMKMSRMELLMAGNEQFFAQAMHAAEAAVEAQIAAASFVITAGERNTVNAATPATIAGSSTIEYLSQGMAPDGGYSDDVLTYRFRIKADGQAPVGAVRANVAVNQGIYILAPGGGT